MRVKYSEEPNATTVRLSERTIKIENQKLLKANFMQPFKHQVVDQQLLNFLKTVKYPHFKNFQCLPNPENEAIYSLEVTNLTLDSEVSVKIP